MARGVALLIESNGGIQQAVDVHQGLPDRHFAEGALVRARFQSTNLSLWKIRTCSGVPRATCSSSNRDLGILVHTLPNCTSVLE